MNPERRDLYLHLNASRELPAFAAITRKDNEKNSVTYCYRCKDGVLFLTRSLVFSDAGQIFAVSRVQRFEADGIEILPWFRVFLPVAMRIRAAYQCGRGGYDECEQYGC